MCLYLFWCCAIEPDLRASVAVTERRRSALQGGKTVAIPFLSARMTRRIELLAPGGDLDSIKAAIIAGADAIYCGLDAFNARQRATNVTFDDLGGILALAHRHDCRVFLTLNIMMGCSPRRTLWSPDRRPRSSRAARSLRSHRITELRGPLAGRPPGAPPLDRGHPPCRRQTPRSGSCCWGWSDSII